MAAGGQRTEGTLVLMNIPCERREALTKASGMRALLVTSPVFSEPSPARTGILGFAEADLGELWSCRSLFPFRNCHPFPRRRNSWKLCPKSYDRASTRFFFLSFYEETRGPSFDLFVTNYFYIEFGQRVLQAHNNDLSPQVYPTYP